MKKLLSVVLVVLSMAAMLCACGKTEGKTPATADVARAVKESTSFAELIELNNDNIGRRYYGIDLDSIEEYCVMVCSSGARADEIAVFKMKEQDDVEDMLEIIRERKQELYDSFVDYVPEEIGKIENATIGSNGNYVYLIVCDKRAEAKAAVEACF